MRALGRYAVALSLSLYSLPLVAQGNSGPVKTGAEDPIEVEGYIKPPAGVAKLVAALFVARGFQVTKLVEP